MLGPATTYLRPLTEQIVDEIIDNAGGRRAHPDQAQKKRTNADYILGETVIELKIMEDEGLDKAPRPAKLAALFTELDPERPVHVLERDRLDASAQRAYDNAMESPIKSAVRKAKGQMKQTRLECPETTRSVLLLINSMNTALDHDEIVALAGRRARTYIGDIDGVVVAGAYLHSDGFDSLAIWPIEYVAVSLDKEFAEFPALRAAFNEYAERAMTEIITSPNAAQMTKGPVLDSEFDVDGQTFVKPAPPLGSSSDFYVGGRPRLNSTGIDTSPTVGLIFPELNRREWARFREYMPCDPELGETYEDWLQEREHAVSQGHSLKPFVAMRTTFDGWIEAIEESDAPSHFASVKDYANKLYQDAIVKVIEGAQDLDKCTIVPNRYVLAVTEVIGQDQANDVSHIFIVEEFGDAEPRMIKLVSNARIFHLHACTLGASYAVKFGIMNLRWKKDLTYAWA